MIFLENLPKPREGTVCRSKGQPLLQKPRNPFPNPVSGHGLSPFESQELNLLDQDRFVRFLLTDSDPVSTALSI
jgi:hypothetical protein